MGVGRWSGKCSAKHARRSANNWRTRNGHGEGYEPRIYPLGSHRLFHYGDSAAFRHPYLQWWVGVLAGDTVRSAADLELPLVTVSLASRLGYFRQHIDEAGRQQEDPDSWDPAALAPQLQARVVVAVEGGRLGGRLALCA